MGSASINAKRVPGSINCGCYEIWSCTRPISGRFGSIWLEAIRAGVHRCCAVHHGGAAASSLAYTNCRFQLDGCVGCLGVTVSKKERRGK